jgi:hypothetical protein
VLDHVDRQPYVCLGPDPGVQVDDQRRKSTEEQGSATAWPSAATAIVLTTVRGGNEIEGTDRDDEHQERRSELAVEAPVKREGAEAHSYWKISVVQSPPWRRTSCARARPAGRSWKSTKKSGSTSIPPSGEQFTRRSQERRPG